MSQINFLSPQILKFSIPECVGKYLSDADDMPDHHHRSIILNLACGGTVCTKNTRHSLIQEYVLIYYFSNQNVTNLLLLSHCADAVFSLANNNTVPDQVVSTIAAFAIRWIRTASTDLDVIIGNTIDQEWARLHQPVVSTKEEGHILYTRFDTAQPEGKLVCCPYDCKAPIVANKKERNVQFTCTGCKCRATAKLVKSDRETVLGRAGLRKTTFPQEIFKEFTTWWHPPEPVISVEYRQPLPEPPMPGGSTQETEPTQPIFLPPDSSIYQHGQVIHNQGEDERGQGTSSMRGRGRVRRSKDRQKDRRPQD